MLAQISSLKLSLRILATTLILCLVKFQYILRDKCLLMEVSSDTIQALWMAVKWKDLSRSAKNEEISI